MKTSSFFKEEWLPIGCLSGSLGLVVVLVFVVVGCFIVFVVVFILFSIVVVFVEKLLKNATAWLTNQDSCFLSCSMNKSPV